MTQEARDRNGERSKGDKPERLLKAEQSRIGSILHDDVKISITTMKGKVKKRREGGRQEARFGHVVSFQPPFRWQCRGCVGSDFVADTDPLLKVPLASSLFTLANTLQP